MRSGAFSGPSRPTALAAAVFVFALHLLFTSTTTLWDRDEPRFAQAAVEMIRSGNYLYPTFSGDVRAQKPVLIYWLMALSMTVLGASEIGARFWAPVGLAATAYATWVIGRRLGSPRAGRLAMVIVALNPLAMLEGTAATTDAVLLALITCAIAAFVWRLTSDAVLAPAAVYTLALAGALLAKGPVGLLPVLVAGGTLWQRRRLPDSARIAVQFGLASLAGGALFALWAVPANAASGGRFYTQGFQHDIVTRVLSPLEGHGGNPLLWLPFYPAVVVIGLAPWSAYVPEALAALWRRGRAWTDADRVLTWWIAGPFVAFTLAATHLPHYVLPAWPALALAVALLLDNVVEVPGDNTTRRWRARGAWLVVAAALAAGAALVGAPIVLGAPALLWRSALAIGAMAVTMPLFVRALRRADHGPAFGIALGGTILFQGLMGVVWLPAVERVKPVPRIAGIVRARDPGATRTATYQFGEPSLDFYLGASPQTLDTPSDLEAWAARPGSGFLVTTRAALADGRARAGSLREIAAAAGFDVAKGRPIELVLLERGRP